MAGSLALQDGSGASQIRAGQLVEARATYEATLAAEPHQMSALNDLAVSYYLEGRLDAARQLFDEVVERGSPREQQIALINLGELLALDGNASAAQDYFEAARSIDQAHAEPVYALALLADLRGNRDGAGALLRDALKLDPMGRARASLVFIYPEERVHLSALLAEVSGDREQAGARWASLREARFPALAAAAATRP